MDLVGVDRSGMDEKQLAELSRLDEDTERIRNWKRWGPYLSERQWGTVREDYSPGGTCWEYFPHDHARSRAYRWGEDGLLGVCDRQGRLCLSLALWNEKDAILKERLFGLTGPEGNHGEDVKEEYFYLDSTPTHSYLRGLYKYPQQAFPYDALVRENGRRGKHEPEYELVDTGAFSQNRYFDVFAEYAKNSPDDLLLRITVHNRGPESARLHVLPTLWFRNTWSWGCAHEGCWVKPRLWLDGERGEIVADHATLERFRFAADRGPGGAAPTLLFCDNETNTQRLYGSPGPRYPKDAIHDAIVSGAADATHGARGTKCAAHYVLEIPAGGSQVLRARLWADQEPQTELFGDTFDRVFAYRIREADEFYDAGIPSGVDAPARNVLRQAAAGLLWSKQFYHYVVKDWLEGDPDQPTPPAQRLAGRNRDWSHVFNRDIISMPDKWEYPWFAAWDLAFHMLPMAKLDPAFAKEQLLLFLREWYMHPSGQIPAYEFAFDDVNPPVHAWACWRVYKMTGTRGTRDVSFLQRAFQKLIINFTWWVNRKDPEGKHLFSGGFLGLDNIGVFDRSKPLPTGGFLQQADGTAWMAFYCSTMLSIALELAQHEPAYEDVASKFFEHFVAITDAMNRLGGTGLWDEEDGFYYDRLRVGEGSLPLRVRSMVGLIPLFAGEVLEDAAMARLPGFRKRLLWFVENRRDLAAQISYLQPSAENGGQGRRLLAIPSRDRLTRVLRYLLDEQEFLSPHGIRSLSRVHGSHPFILHVGGTVHRVDYDPGESTSGLFGGNSNWRGPIWFPVNFLLCEALERYHHFYGDSLKVELPTGSGRWLNLGEVARELGGRLAKLFLPDATGRRPCHGDDPRYAQDPHYRDLALFYEYFHGETGQGLGASHQTGWTALVGRHLMDLGKPGA